jgi:hypothetical protein
VRQQVEPGQLVGEARLAAGIAVGQVDAGNGDAVRLDLDVARLGVVRRQARQCPMPHRERHAGEHGDAVVGLLAHHLRPIAEAMVCQRRKSRRFALDLLEQQDIGLATLEPACDVPLALADRVDVPGRYLHGRTKNRSTTEAPRRGE